MVTVTRVALQDEIIRTKEKFHRWLVTIPEDALQHPSRDPGWTNGEIIYRISISPLVIKSALKRSPGNRSSFFHPKLVTGALIQKTNEISIRANARNITLWSLAKEYEENCNLILALLDGITDADFEKQITIMEDDPLLSGSTTVAQLFHYVKKLWAPQKNML
jgi:hypothetical protein